MPTKIHIDDILNSPLLKPKQEVDARDIFTVEKKEKAVVPDVISLEPDEPLELPRTGRMLVRIEIDKSTKDGNGMHVVAEINNQEDLNGFMYKFRDYVPSGRSWWKKLLDLVIKK